MTLVLIRGLLLYLIFIMNWLSLLFSCIVRPFHEKAHICALKAALNGSTSLLKSNVVYWSRGRTAAAAYIFVLPNSIFTARLFFNFSLFSLCSFLLYFKL